MKKFFALILVLMLVIPCVSVSAAAATTDEEEESSNWEEVVKELPQTLEGLEEAFEQPHQPLILNDEDGNWFRQRMNQFTLETGFTGAWEARCFYLPYNGKVVIAYRAITGDGELYIDNQPAEEFYASNWHRFLPKLPQDLDSLEKAFEEESTQPLTGEAGRWFRQHLSQLMLATGLAGFQQVRLYRVGGEVVIAYRAVGGDGTVGALYINSVPAEEFYN